MNVLQLGEASYPLGNLTGAHLEDHYEAVQAFTAMSGVPDRAQFSATVTLLHQAMAAGGSGLTRAEVAALVQLPQLASVIVAVGRALGFEPSKVTQGEAERPQVSPE
jgi:hypothetical protein